MKTHIVTISEVKALLKTQELKFTNQMDKEIKVRVKDEVFKESQVIKKQIMGELGL